MKALYGKVSKSAGLILIWIFMLSASLQANEKQKPNIVFILADDLGYTDLGCYGNPFHKTPFLDSLARSGILFTQAYSTSPVSSPSRAAILTGRHPARLHLTNFLTGNKTDTASPVLPAPWKNYLSSDEVTLAELLREQGYSTGIVGKWHLGNADSLTAAAQGFDYDRIIARNGLDYYNYAIAEKNRVIFEDTGSVYLTDKLTDYALEFISSVNNKPFFLYMCYSAPHVLLVPRSDKLAAYLFSYSEYGGKYNPYYAAMLESLDDGVRKIVDQLKRQDLLENTLIIFTSDNGGVGLPELGPVPTCLEPLRAWKGHVYEGGIRVPLILSWKDKIKAGSVDENCITGVDFLPTLMDIAGLTSSYPVDGISFSRCFTDTGYIMPERPVFWHYPHFSNQNGRPSGAIRMGNYKLVESYETGKTELYDLKTDVSEINDLSSTETDKATALHEIFMRWRNEVGANMPLPNPKHYPVK
jgi:arylsulfatase A-like enzyme